jgi:hypothetical protein
MVLEKVAHVVVDEQQVWLLAQWQGRWSVLQAWVFY